jgi:hypothetical protein
LKRVLVTLTGKEKTPFDQISDQDIIDADDNEFMGQDPKTNNTVPITMPMQFVQPLPFQESQQCININRLSHDGLKIFLEVDCLE